ncbi:MAG: NeuD/PglB/VioB family sugar acetyltransferase [Phycisphaerales bacterium JB060]
MSNPVTLIGGGGHAKVVADSARAAGLAIAGFVDDDPGATVPGLDHLGPTTRAAEPWHLCIGCVPTRVKVLDTLTGLTASIIHPMSIVSIDAVIGNGVFVGPGAVINAGATIDEHAIINSAAVVEHDARVGLASHIAPGAIVCGGVVVGAGCLIGANATLLPGVHVGDGAIVGAGALVRGSVPGRAVAVGVPARVLEQRGGRSVRPR